MRFVPPLVFITVIFQHFRLFNIGGYEATIGLLSGSFVVALLVVKLNLKILLTAWAALIGISSITALLAPETVSTDYWETLGLFLLAILIVTSSFSQLKWSHICSNGVALALLWALAIIVLLSVGQVVLGSLGSDLLFNPFGSNQYLHPYRPNIGLVQFPRAHGFFLEPSYNAFVMGTLATALLSLHRFTKAAVVLAVFGLAACQSATGLVLLVLLLGIVAIRSRPAIALTSAGLILAVILYAGDYLWIRLLSFGTEGSSAYYRVFAPLEALMDILENRPIGMPLGSVERVMGGYELEMAGVQAKSLDNGFYVIVFYFGWIGVLLLLIMLTATLVFMRNRVGQSLSWIAPLWLFASLFFSGGIMAPEFALMTFVVVAALRSNIVYDNKDREASIATQHHNGYVPRLSRLGPNNRIIGANSQHYRV